MSRRMSRHQSAQPSGLKQSVYLPEGMYEELVREAQRQDRSVSWLIQKAWRLARAKLAEIPGANDPEEDV